MKRLLHSILKEFQLSKTQSSNKTDVLQTTINGNKNISGFNTLIGALFSSNRGLSGSFTTTKFLMEKELSIEEEAPKVTFLEYNIAGSVIFLKEDIERIFPNFDPNNKNSVELVKRSFERGQINSFSVDIKEIIEKDLGKTYEIDFEKNILNYRKIEAIPNEYVIGLKQQEKREDLSVEQYKLKEEIEQRKYDNFNEAQQHFFYLLTTLGRANIKMLNHFDLTEIDNGLFVTSNNNYILSKEMEISPVKEYLKLR